MRRRRQKNNLLPKMLGLAVLINAILLPILAQFGAFKSIGGGQRLTPVELVKAPPPERRPARPKKTPKRQAAKPHRAGHKAASRPATSRRVPSGPPPVKVVAAAGPPGGNGNSGDAGITTSDSGPAPTPVPPEPNAGSGQPAPPLAPAAPPAVQPPPTTPPVTPPVAPPPPPHVPTITVAVPLSQPQPSIPDDLRDADLNAAFEGLFTIHPDGTASVKMVSSTGKSTLDLLALEAARRWTFRPATRDGQPVESYLRIKIEFQVNS